VKPLLFSPRVFVIILVVDLFYINPVPLSSFAHQADLPALAVGSSQVKESLAFTLRILNFDCNRFSILLPSSQSQTHPVGPR